MARPPLSPAVRARVLAAYAQMVVIGEQEKRKSLRLVATEVGIAVSSVHKVLNPKAYNPKLTKLNRPARCPKCGAKIVFAPCQRCEHAERQGRTLKPQAPVG